MDGVIVDSEPLHRRAYFRMFDEVGIGVSESLYNSFTGQATLPICKALCEEFKLKRPAEELVEIKRKHFKDIFQNDMDFELIDGVLELIQDYHKNGLTLVLASSASMANIERIFERFDLDQYFVAKISGADLKASKPHPEIFIKAAALAGEKAEHCMVLEDSTNGIRAAKDANIFCVAYKSANTRNQDYSRANIVISDFREIYFSKLKSL